MIDDALAERTRSPTRIPKPRGSGDEAAELIPGPEVRPECEETTPTLPRMSQIPKAGGIFWLPPVRGLGWGDADSPLNDPARPARSPSRSGSANPHLHPETAANPKSHGHTEQDPVPHRCPGPAQEAVQDRAVRREADDPRSCRLRDHPRGLDPGAGQPRRSRKFKDDFFDWNEVRVSSLEEIQGILAGMTDAEGRAFRVRRFLRQLFEKTYGFNLDRPGQEASEGVGQVA